MKSWDELESDRYRDFAVAEHVMGWKPAFKAEFIVAPGGRIVFTHEVPYYSQDASADYSVLEKVRSEWGSDQRRWNRFQCNVYDIQSARRSYESTYAYRWVDLGYYEPGDYSRAAYETLRQEAGE